MDHKPTHDNTSKMIALTHQVSANNYHPLPVVISNGKGIWVTDIDNHKYLDCLAAYSAANQGHCHPKIISALIDQAQKLTISSRAFHNETMGPFLEKLCKYTGFDKALPMNTGAEAVETALKLARKWGYQNKDIPENQAEIIVCDGNFHGRTISIISFSSEKQYKDQFGPLTEGFKSIPYGCSESLSKAITPNTVGFLFEPIQGEGGVIVPPDGYLQDCLKICREKNVLMINDEIQTGFGRTGKTFCGDYEHTRGDILIMGKALGGGVYPVSAVCSSKDIMDVIKPGDHGSTFGGNPLGSAVGIASLEVLEDEQLPEKSYELGKHFKETLKNIKSEKIKEVRGKGLMIGIEIKQEFGNARKYCQILQEKGILCKETHQQVIRMTPPLVISKSDLDWVANQLEQALQEAS